MNKTYKKPLLFIDEINNLSTNLKNRHDPPQITMSYGMKFSTFLK